MMPDAGDAGVGDGGRNDANVIGVDAGSDSGVRPDAGRAALCTGTGCNVVAIEALSATTCVLRANGQVDCWGRGQNGELGDGAMHHTDECRQTPELNVDCSRDAVTVALPHPAERLFSRGSAQMCARLVTSHEIWCWGGLIYQLGSTLAHAMYAPEHVLVNGTGVADGTSSYTTSYGVACWVNADTSASCLGFGSAGRLGYNNFADSSVPVTPLLPSGSGPILGVIEIETNGPMSCARTASHLYCWGSNQFGQLGVAPPHQSCGTGSTHYDCTPLAVEVTGVNAATIVDMELDGDYTCVLHSTGHMQCWGLGASGGLGNADINSTHTPVEPIGISNVAEMRIANGATCAMLHDGTVWCWGAGDLGQMGDGVMAHNLPACTALADQTSCAANALCNWTGTTCRQKPCVDEGGSLFDCQLTPVQVTGITDAVHLAAGSHYLCALRASGQIWCWGESLRYQLGNEMRPTPAYAPVMSIALGS